MRAPDTHRLVTWLTGPPGAKLPPRLPPPPGHWIVCGYGRFGEAVTRAIEAGGFDVTVVDPDEPPAEGLDLVQGLGSDADSLRAAGIAEAEGIVAGTDDDIANLAMAMAARKLRPGIFVIARQNLLRNAALFTAFGAEMTMIPNEIVAHECIALLRARHLSSFLAIAHAEDDAWAAAATARLEPVVGQGSPEIWSFTVREAETPGLLDALRRAGSARLDDLVRDPADRSGRIDAVPLLLVREGERLAVPAGDGDVRPGDALLYAGRERARRAMEETLLNANTAEYVFTGRDRPSSLLARLIDRLRGASPAAG